MTGAELATDRFTLSSAIMIEAPQTWRPALAYAWLVPTRVSAGILLFRRSGGLLEVLLGHPGGPFFGRKDVGNWSIPKGETSPSDRALELTARREFEEETGHPVLGGQLIDLGWVKQKGGKIVYAWAAEGDLDPAAAISNTFSFEWPPFSGRMREYPEIDRVAWYDPVESRSHIKPAQIPFLDRLEDRLLGATPSEPLPFSGSRIDRPGEP
jgi:predicted NUDIX family NTP pyrophosphohydrolase